MRFIICLCFIALTFIFSQPLSADGNDRNLLKAREYVQIGLYEKAEKYFKRSLKGNKDPKVLLELATLYEIQKKYYLAGLAFRQLGMTGEFNKMEQLRLASFKDAGSPAVWESAKIQSELFSKAYKRKRAAGITLAVIGGTAIVTGTVLLGVFGGGGLLIGTPLMFGGLTLISSGLVIDSSAKYDLKTSEAFNKISGSYYDPETSAMEYYETSGIKLSVMKETSTDLKKKGIALTAISVPLIITSIGCFIGSSAAFYRIDHSNDDDESMDEGMGDFGNALAAAITAAVGIAAIVPGVIILSGGITLLSMSSKWSRLNPKAGIVTLNSIAPMIDPVSKTYGLSMGFSF